VLLTRYVSTRHTLTGGYKNTCFYLREHVLPSVNREFVMKSNLCTPNCHPRPRHFYSETTMIDNLMTTPWWNQHEIARLLLGDINIARRCCKFSNRHCMGFQVQLSAQGLKILGHKRSRRAVSHEPKRRAPVLGITHKIVSKRGAEIFVARCECISYTQVAH
jgi:hypothetical protein